VLLFSYFIDLEGPEIYIRTIRGQYFIAQVQQLTIILLRVKIDWGDLRRARK
jgi:hypothetical protein